MLNWIAEIFSPQTSPAPQSTQERIPLATCVVLLEAARADDEFTDEERAHILTTMQERFKLSESEAQDLLEQAQVASDQSSDLWHFTHIINEAFSPEDKILILEEVWRLFYSDGSLDGHEDHLAHQLQNLLNLNHKQLIQAKMTVLEEIRGRKA